MREKLQIDSPFYFYLHGLATIALWPLERFGVLQLFNANDLFIATCDGDINSMKISFNNARTAKIPFTLVNTLVPSELRIAKLPFIFIGRISPQKNLDSLIKSYAKLDKATQEEHPLIIYGNEDHLGYPNLGILEHFYLQKLKQLASKLNVENQCQFRGFLAREKIQEIHGSN